MKPLLSPLVASLFSLLLPCPAVATDLAAYRTGKPEERIASVPAEIGDAIFKQPSETIEPLVRWLIRDVRDDFLKVKTLHDWVADNIDYDVENYLAGGSPESSWQATLTRRKAFCQGYAELMQKMCQIAGVACEVIPGHGRGYGFVVGQAEDVRKTNHAWNAVKIGDQWYLLDACWDAGHIEGRSYRKQYGTAYLFPDPAYFLYTHFPAEAKWQLLARPLSAEEFAALPMLEGRFFERGLRLATALRRLQPVAESVQFSVTTPEDVVLMARLVEAGKSEDGQLTGRTLLRRRPKETNVLVSFPAAGRWGVKLFTKSRSDPGMYWQVALLEFQASLGTPWTFAETWSSVEGVDSFLENPVYVPLETGKQQEFKIRVRGAEKVQLKLGPRTWLPLQPTAGDPELYRVTADVPTDARVQIVAQPPGRGNRYWTIADFTPERK